MFSLESCLTKLNNNYNTEYAAFDQAAKARLAELEQMDKKALKEHSKEFKELKKSQNAEAIKARDKQSAINALIGDFSELTLDLKAFEKKENNPKLTEQEKLLNAEEKQKAINKFEKYKTTKEYQSKIKSRTKRLQKLETYLANDPTKHALGEFIFPGTFTPNTSSIAPDESALRAEFDTLNEQHGYFNDDREKSFAAFKSCHSACDYVATIIEDNNQPDEIASRAYKMMVFFGEENALRGADHFIKGKLSNTEILNDGSVVNLVQNPVHDLLYHNIPTFSQNDKELHLKEWRELIDKAGLEAISSFSSAHEIEEQRIGAGLSEVPSDKAQLSESLAKIIYPRYEENPEFATICKHYKVNTETFNRGLDLINDGTIKLKDTDNLPDIVVNCSETNPNKTNYYLVRLPSNNLRGLILGDITGCCQSVNGNSEKCVIDGMTLANNGFYALVEGKNGSNFDPQNINWQEFEKNGHKIHGQGYCWRGRNGALTFDSWENSDSVSNNEMIGGVLKEFAKKAMENDDTISRVTIGTGGGTPNNIKNNSSPAQPEPLLEGSMYGDASRQVELMVSKELQELRDDLALKTGIADQSYIVSLEQGRKLNSYTPEFLASIGDLYPIIIHQNTMSNHSSQADLENLATTLNTIKSQDPEKLILLNRKSFLESNVYYENYIKIEDIKELSTEKIALLVTPTAYSIYKDGYSSIDELKEFNYYKMMILTSPTAYSIYKDGYSSIDELKELDADTAGELSCPRAYYLYKNGHSSINEFRNLEPSERDKLLSDGGWKLMSKVGVTSDQVRKCSIEQLEVLSSSPALAAYSCEVVTFDQLRKLPADKIRALTSRDAIINYQDGYVNFEDIKDLPVDKIEALTSWEANSIYTEKHATINDLKDLPVDKIKIFTSNAAKELYSKGYTTIDQIKTLDSTKTGHLFSTNARILYDKKYATVDDLNQLTSNQLKKLNSVSIESLTKENVQSFITKAIKLNKHSQANESKQNLKEKASEIGKNIPKTTSNQEQGAKTTPPPNSNRSR